MAGSMVPSYNNSAALAQIVQQLNAALKPEIQGLVKDACKAVLNQNGQNGQNGSAVYPSSTSTPGACVSPAAGAPGAWIPSLQIPGCPVQCDPCLYPGMQMDLSLHAWPEIQAQMYSRFTQLNVIVPPGAFPLAAGASITLQQQGDRTITYVPECIQASTTWSGGPAQDGLLTYQLAVGPKDGSGPFVLFGDPIQGQQFICGDNCSWVDFPEYMGCSNLPIPTLSALRMIITLDASATSQLDNVRVTIQHRRKFKSACSCGCGGGNSCSCG